MNNRLYIGNRIIETPDELKELFGLEDMLNPSSSLFNKLLDNVYDEVLQDFLRVNGDMELAERIDGIDLNDSESSIMSHLISIMTNTEVYVSSNPLDYISILGTTIELRDNPLRFVAVFKVKVNKKDNRKIVLTIVQRPKESKGILSRSCATLRRTQSAHKNLFFGDDMINTIKQVQENVQKSVEQIMQNTIQQAPVTTMSELFSTKHIEEDTSPSPATKPTAGVSESEHRDNNNTPNPTNKQVDCIEETIELKLNQVRQEKVIRFECNVEKNKDIIFKVDDDIVSEIAAKEMEQLAYQEAKKQNEINNYLTLFPYGLHASELKEKKELQMYEKCNTIDGCKEYLKLYPEGKYAKEINFRAWLFTDMNSVVESTSFCGGKLRYEMVKTAIFLIFIAESGGYDALSNALSIIGDKARSMANYHGVDIEKEFKNLEQLLNGPASNDYKYQCLVSSSFYRALQQSIPENVHKAIDRNIAIVFPDIIP